MLQIPQTSNPFADGLAQAQALTRSAMQNWAMAKTNPSNVSAINAQNNATAQYAMPMGLAKLNVLNAQSPQIQAQTAQTRESTALMPKNTQIALLNALVKQGMMQNSSSRFLNPAYNWRMGQMALTPAGKAQSQANNAPQVANLTNAMTAAASNWANAGMPAGATATSAVSGAGANPYMSPINDILKSLNVSPASVPQASAGNSGLSTLASNPSSAQSIMQGGSQTPYVSPQDINSMRTAAQNQYIKDTVPTKLQEQRAYSAIAGNLYNKANSFVPSVTKYAGFGGSFQNLINKIGSGGGGVNSPDYQNLLNFRQQAPVLANEIRRQLGGQATDTEARVMNQLVDPNIWNKSPQQVLGLWKNLGNIINTTGATLKEDQATIASNLGKEAQIISTPTPNQTANVSIPSFNSKAEFQSWYGNLDPDKQNQVRAQLGK